MHPTLPLAHLTLSPSRLFAPHDSLKTPLSPLSLSRAEKLSWRGHLSYLAWLGRHGSVTGLSELAS